MPKSPRRNHLFQPAAILITLLLAAPTGAAARPEEFPGEGGKWRRYQTPHFEMFSAARDGESRRMLHSLELLRALFFETFKVKERQPQEVSIYYFNDSKTFKAYCQSQQRQSLAGFYLTRPDRAVIVLSPTWDDENARAVIFHEYIHHLNRLNGVEPPLWYNEGVAELLSTVVFEKDGALLGEPLPWHVVSLLENKLLPLETLFAVDTRSTIYNTGKHSGQFYAESWALMHYLHFGSTKLDTAKVGLFLTYILNESPEADPEFRRKLFQETMGMDYAEMLVRLKDYVTGGRYRAPKYPLPKVAAAETYESQPMPPAKIRARLAELALRVVEMPGAKSALMDAAEKDPGEYRAWEILGTDAWMQADIDLAQERWQRALAAGSRNPGIFHELGQIESRRWFTNFNYDFRMPEERAKQLRTLLLRSIEAAPEQFAAYEGLAWVEASVVKPDIANVNRVQQRFNLLRQKTRTLLALALVRVHLGETEDAVKLLDQLDRLKPDFRVASAAETIRARLEDRAPRIIARPAPEPTQHIQIKMQMPEVPK